MNMFHNATITHMLPLFLVILLAGMVAGQPATVEADTGLFSPDSPLYGLQTAWDSTAVSLGVKDAGDVALQRASEVKAMEEEGNPAGAARAAKQLGEIASEAEEADQENVQIAVASTSTSLHNLDQDIDETHEDIQEDIQQNMDELEDRLDELDQELDIDIDIDLPDIPDTPDTPDLPDDPTDPDDPDAPDRPDVPDTANGQTSLVFATTCADADVSDPSVETADLSGDTGQVVAEGEILLPHAGFDASAAAEEHESGALELVIDLSSEEDQGCVSSGEFEYAIGAEAGDQDVTLTIEANGDELYSTSGTVTVS